MKILLDPHVHIYDSYDLNLFFESTFFNFKQAAKITSNVDAYSIILTERIECDFFNKISNTSNFNDIIISKLNGYLKAEKQNYPPLFIFPGQQTNSKEGLEILALFRTHKLPSQFPALELIEEIKSNNSICIINWAPGKWLGKRGKFLSSILPILDKTIGLGITSLLPKCMPLPQLITQESQKGRLIILGSDPLPFSLGFNKEEKIPGTCGLIIETEDNNLEKSIPNYLMTTPSIKFYGKRGSFIKTTSRILINEIKRRCKKHKNTAHAQ